MNYKKIPINGIVLINKPQKLSSNKALQIIKKKFKAQKAGHTGSLDPMATGLLPILFGRSTKFARYMLNFDKEYIAKIKLGISTDSGDSEGNIISVNEDIMTLSEENIKKILPKFTGLIEQTPPVYSAIKIHGTPSYKLARKGIDVEIKPRKIRIIELKFLKYDHKSKILDIYVKCSKGTYIRSLAIDIGNVLDCGGHLIGLNRLSCGPLKSDKVIALNTLDSQNSEDLYNKIESIESAFTDCSILEIKNSELSSLNNKFITQDLCDGVVRIYLKKSFIGVGFIKNKILINKVLIQGEDSK